MAREWLIQVIGLVLTHISGPMRDVIVKAVKEWEVKAKETADPWDDMLVFIIKCLLLIP